MNLISHTCRGGLFPAASNFVFSGKIKRTQRQKAKLQAAGNRPPLQRANERPVNLVIGHWVIGHSDAASASPSSNCWFPIAVLVLLITMVTQLVNSAGLVITAAAKHMDADNAAREVMDRMVSDLALMVKRKDLNYIFYKPSGSAGTSSSTTRCFFYSEGPASASTTTNLSSTGAESGGYRINTTNTFFKRNPGARNGWVKP